MKKILFPIVFIVLFLHCSENEYDSDNNQYYGEREISFPQTEIAGNKQATIQHVRSINIKEIINYVGEFWKLLVYNNLLFISDWISVDIKVYKSTGELVRTIGKKGAGPGEFIDVRGGIAIQNDTLFVIDPALRRLNIFHIDGSYIRSFPLPSPVNYAGTRGELYAINDTIIMPIIENRYSPMIEYHLSHTISFLDKHGNILQLFGSHPHEYTVFNMYMPNLSIAIDEDNNIYQLSRESPVIHKYNSSGELIKIFGVVVDDYKPVYFNYSPDMPIPEIIRLSKKRSYATNLCWLPSQPHTFSSEQSKGYIVHTYDNLTEEGLTKSDPLLYDRYLQVYTDNGIYIPSNIPINGLLLASDGEGFLYILTDNTPGNITIDIFALHIEDE